ncbi:hypothetical protein M758_11G002800 [Ceratodon purpureus]|uniref:Uncharacterized protein n=1 Tax=Ceratodon purpureus TaxID=3225 RepID=A0A8T0GAQ7_CERPU|nr:hypothetical protein KC19_11G003500 [Ceratodon purpureus]KAG0600044.1 hypothetical protein M758_11G002800 [Ceratodon purpureus]
MAMAMTLKLLLSPVALTRTSLSAHPLGLSDPLHCTALHSIISPSPFHTHLFLLLLVS